jgi:hypothetical protein
METARAAQAARRELAKRLGIALADAKLASVREIDAKAAADGCALPGEESGRAYDVRLTANGNTYQYRARGGQAVFCSSDREK